MLAVIPAAAQEQNLFEAPDNLYGGLRQDENGVVGTIGSSVDVSALGGATYSIPIQVPDGIHGVQPSISIVYNSQSGNGYLGWNWSFTGLSVISRVGSSIYHDGANDGIQFNQNNYSLDGQRLMLIDDSNNETTEYRTELDIQSKIVCYSNANSSSSYFKVWLSNGLIAYYGNTDDTNIKLQEENNTCFWLLSRIEDRDGNYMTYHYNYGGAHYYLNCIKYGGNSVIGTEPLFKIQFNYIDREPETMETQFIVKNALKMTKLLTNIEILKQKTYNNWILLQKYSFDYIPRKESPNSPFGLYIYERLESINLSYYDNNFNPPSESHVNPTLINWGTMPEIYNGNTNPPFTAGYKTVVNLHNNSISQEQKYVGDFNGDGLSDFIVTNEDENNKKIHLKLYTNQGNTKTNNLPGEVSFEMHETIINEIEYSRVIWVYVCDFNGDGLDDFLVLYYRASPWPYGEKILRAYKSVIENGLYRSESIYYQLIGPGSTPSAVFVGDFRGRGKSDIIIQLTSNYEGHKYPFQYFEYIENGNGSTLRKTEAQIVEGNNSISQYSFPYYRYATGDFDHDGRTEIWAADENENGYFYRILETADGHYYHEAFQAFSNSQSTPFVGDFNGDGVSDILYHNGNNWYVQICAAPDTYGYFTYYLTHELGAASNYIPPYFGYDKDDRRANMTYNLEIADINGDGKSDVVVINRNGELTILYSPIIPGNRATETPHGHFAYKETFDASSAGLTNNVYARCTGNFLGQENQSILEDAILFSTPPISDYYNVASISDGMGNRIDFEYDYLIDNPQRTNDDFYTLNRDASATDLSIYAMALPIKAVKKLTKYNEADPLLVKSITEYSYSNALVHRKGKGILGLMEYTMESYTENAPFHNYTRKLFNIEAMGGHCAIMPTAENTFLKRASNGHLKRITESTFTYDKHVHSQNALVFIPLLTNQITDYYSIDCQENGIPKFLKREINHKDYGWSYNLPYRIDSYSATTTNHGITTYNNCEYQEEWSYNIMENYIDNWIIHQPLNVGIGHGYEFLLYEDIYQYNTDIGKPHQLKKLYRIPNQHYASEYVICNTYTYDAAGNIISETMSGENNTSLPERKTEYTYNDYRLLKSKKEWINETEGLFYTTSYKYDPYFDFINSETNCRGQETRFSRDPLGINCTTTSPNGIVTRTQKGWLPDNTGYYEWTYTEGSAPVMTYYDMKGNMTKTETYGFDETQLIVKQYNYNALGQLESEEDSHLNGTTSQLTEYTYDDYGRLRKTVYPDGNTVRVVHDPDDGFKTSTTVTNADGTHITTQKLNAIGLVETSWDEMGIPVNYTYTLDGLLETATVNNDPNTTVSVEYDEARNRVRLHDPDYCGNGNDMVYTYDAYGQLRTQNTPKGDVTIYDYDALGRTISRTEGYDLTEWIYHNSDSRYKGLLQEVRINGTQEKTTYCYDSQTRRLTETCETIFGNSFNPTQYTYYDNGKTETVIYPTGFRLKKHYTSTGHLKQIVDKNGKNLWTTETLNAHGQITHFRVSDEAYAMKGECKYYEKTHFLEFQKILNNNNERIHYYWYKYDKFGNLARRTCDNHWVGEYFKYDELNRLTQSKVTYQGQEYISDIVYDDNDYGCIKSKTAAYAGAPAIIQADYGTNGRPHAINKADIGDSSFPTNKLSTEYNSFDKLSYITQYDDNGGIDRTLIYSYGYDHQRILSTESENQIVTKVKRYVGNCEFFYDHGTNRSLTYLSGPLGLFAIYEQKYEFGQVVFEQIHYIFTDHLGSITTIVNDKGIVEQELSYDAWGNLRDATTWSSPFTGTPMFDRGFTGHEHLYGFGLINMNGRMYDPALGSFLSPDNYIQSPDNSQSFNRYAYCLNNPLRYVDPSGEFVHLIIGAAVGGTANFLANFKHINNFWQGAAYFGIGALAGGLSAGIGAGIGLSYCGQSFAEGFLGTTVLAAPCALGFTGGFAVGGTSGFVSASIIASGNKWMQNGTFTEGLLAGMTYGVVSGLIGGLAYGGVSAFAAASKGFHPGTGQQYIENSFGNRRMPIVHQNNKNNCMAAATESISTHKGDTPIVTQNDVRGWFPDNTDGPLNDVKVLEKYQEATGRIVEPYRTNIDAELSVTYEKMKSDMIWNPNSDFMISRKIPGQSIGHEVNINRIVERSYKTLFGGMKTEYLYEVMDPYYGGYRFITHDELLRSTNIFKIQ